uniref:Uncharacterized protein n=1 Tax=Anguilla anguilla TaxID=7936 RepID=A0A0E9SEV2_ANGAN
MLISNGTFQNHVHFYLCYPYSNCLCNMNFSHASCLKYVSTNNRVP